MTQQQESRLEVIIGDNKTTDIERLLAEQREILKQKREAPITQAKTYKALSLKTDKSMIYDPRGMQEAIERIKNAYLELKQYFNGQMLGENNIIAVQERLLIYAQAIMKYSDETNNIGEKSRKIGEYLKDEREKAGKSKREALTGVNSLRGKYDSATKLKTDIEERLKEDCNIIDREDLSEAREGLAEYIVDISHELGRAIDDYMYLQNMTRFYKLNEKGMKMLYQQSRNIIKTIERVTKKVQITAEAVVPSIQLAHIISKTMPILEQANRNIEMTTQQYLGAHTFITSSCNMAMPKEDKQVEEMEKHMDEYNSMMDRQIEVTDKLLSELK